MDKNVRILIIDGSQDDRKKLIRSLKTIQSAAYRFLEAKNSTTALKFINEPLDCVLLSYSLLDTEGLELLEKIRIHHPFLPVILMTGEGNDGIAAAAVIKKGSETLEKLQESVCQFNLLANSVSQLVWMANETGWIYWYNERWYEYTGTTSKAMESLEWQSVLDPEILPSVMKKWQKSIATGETFEMVLSLKRADGIFLPFVTRIIAVKNADGNVTKWLGTHTNITEQKAAENNAVEALRVSEERYDLTVRSMSIGVWDWNIVTNELYWSKKLLDIMGIDDQEFKPHYDEFSSRLHPEDKEATEKMLFDHLKKLGPFDTEYRLRRNNGEYAWIHALGQAQWNTNDEPTRMAGSVNDVSERKEAEKQMALLASIVQSSEDAIISKTLDSVIVSWNKAAETLFGYAAADIIGKHTNLIIPPDRQDEELMILHEMKLGKPIRHMETIRMRKDGSCIDVALTISPVSDVTGKIIGISKIVHDMSDHKKAERERESLIAKLAESNTELERFAYIASHDMQEPLRMVKNFSRLIAEEYTDKLNDEGKEYIDIVTTGAERMQAMVDDLLEYARMGSNNIQRVWVNAAEEMNHVIENLSPLIKECNAAITYDDLPTFKGNPVQFMRLLQNLIGNGLKYQKQGNAPKIHIAVQNKGEHWCFSVQDNGIGIDEEFVSQVFEPFKRLHSWDEYKGTGIGLAVCRKIVENHGGKIWVTSLPGEGSVFYFTLAK
jgi:two-component system sensor kinase FixL